MYVTYYKRYRMEMRIPLFGCGQERLPHGYSLVPWDESLLELHADVKCRSFATEIDSQVFPCLGEPSGCYRLMEEIARKSGFLSEATWLIAFHALDHIEYCGTIQGIADPVRSTGSIQNLGVTPGHRGQGLGTRLLEAAIAGFAKAGLRRAGLEVTADNFSAVRLYQRFGFRRIKTVYKAVEAAYL
ncbi:MAG: GNAT family N-acetyltransferase [Pirellulaceae bacterium]